MTEVILHYIQMVMYENMQNFVRNYILTYENQTKFIKKKGSLVMFIGIIFLALSFFLVFESTPLSDPYKNIKDRQISGHVSIQQPIEHVLWLSENERILGDVVAEFPENFDQINFLEIRTMEGEKLYQESFTNHLILDYSPMRPAGEYIFTISNNAIDSIPVTLTLGIPTTIHEKTREAVLQNQSFSSSINNDLQSFVQNLGIVIIGIGFLVILYEIRNENNLVRKIFVQDSYSTPLIFIGIAMSLMSFVLLFTINGFGLTLTLFTLGIGCTITIIGLIKNSKLNKMKTPEEKFVKKIEKINQLPVEERQKSLKKLFWRSSAILFLDVGITLHIWRNFYHSFDTEFLFSHPFDFTIILSAICFAIAGIYTLKMKKLGAIFGVIANVLMASSIVLYYVYGGEFSLWIVILKAGTGAVAFRLVAAYKYLK